MAPPATLPTKPLGKTGRQIPTIGLGLMGISVAYGYGGTDEDRLALLDRAWELGETNWDTSDAYGDSEDLVGKWFKLHPERRADIFLATKFAIRATQKPDLTWELGVDNSPEHARAAIDRSLQRLNVDYVDLYYIHRLDPAVPIEKTWAVMAEFKKAGKAKALGISECSSESVERAYKVAPVDAVQVEYNPWQLDIENETGTNLLATCLRLGITVFAYSPLSRGMLTGQFRNRDNFAADDFRRLAPRWSEENLDKNLVLADQFAAKAAKKGCTAAQLALAWLMAQNDLVIPIPGTKKIKYLEENVASVKVKLSPEEVKEIRAEVEKAEVVGHRNPTGFFTEFTTTVPL